MVSDICTCCLALQVHNRLYETPPLAPVYVAQPGVDPIGTQGQFRHLYPERRQGIRHCVGEGGPGGPDASLTRPFHAQRIERRGSLFESDVISRWRGLKVPTP